MTPAPPAIEDYGVIGDLHTAALVARDGSIDWWCPPRFDAASVFAAILDPDRGGRWRIAPAARCTSIQRYLPGSNILVTEFHADSGGVAHVTDCMPVGPARGTWSEIHRRVFVPRGTLAIDVVFEPRFDYARRAPHLSPRPGGLVATDQHGSCMTLASGEAVTWRIDRQAGRAGTRLHLAAGDEAWFILRHDADEVHPLDAYEAPRRLEDTARWWDAWISALRYDGSWKNEVERSALALKLCCYEPTGAIVAAPTTSLPESAGGSRNWDYRYVWLRDSSFVLQALDALGFDTEADRFFRFLRGIARRDDDPHLQIMYTIDGHRDLPEWTLDHLEGYGGSRPVRIGNAAMDQFQLDVFGEVVETAAARRGMNVLAEGTWGVLERLVNDAAARWREPDCSIWEPRMQSRHFVYSKIMAWVALDRGARIARDIGRDGDASRWAEEAEAIRADVLARGFDRSRNAFVQAYDGGQLDAAVLVIPKVGFLPPKDPRVLGTIGAVRQALATSVEELLYRYRAPDGIAAGGPEGAFLFCSFWMIQDVAMAGHLDEARRLFQNLLRRTNHVGLLSEEIHPGTGHFLGNFPQALSHAALINTALVLDRLAAG